MWHFPDLVIFKFVCYYNRMALLIWIDNQKHIEIKRYKSNTYKKKNFHESVTVLRVS